MRSGQATLGLTRTLGKSAAGARASSRATRPFSVRLSEAERQRLKLEAGTQSLGTYVRARLLDGAARRRASTPAADPATLGQILARLGRLQLTTSLDDLTAAARSGSVVMAPELESEVRAACREVRDIRAMLMRALGLKLEARA